MWASITRMLASFADLEARFVRLEVLKIKQFQAYAKLESIKTKQLDTFAELELLKSKQWDAFAELELIKAKQLDAFAAPPDASPFPLFSKKPLFPPPPPPDSG